jgi:GIY-YIG catalytic domain-containing protein
MKKRRAQPLRRRLSKKPIPETHKARGIYGIFSVQTDRVYIGMTRTSFHQRWEAHRSALRNNRHTCTPLQAAWNQFGPNAFEFRILEVLDDDQLIGRREEHWDTVYHDKDYWA